MRTFINILLILTIVIVFYHVIFIAYYPKHNILSFLSEIAANIDKKSVKTMNRKIEVKKKNPQKVIKGGISKMDEIRLRFQRRSEKLKEKCRYLGENIEKIEAIKGFYYSKKYRFINCVVAKVR